MLASAAARGRRNGVRDSERFSGDSEFDRTGTVRVWTDDELPVKGGEHRFGLSADTGGPMSICECDEREEALRVLRERMAFVPATEASA